MNFFSKSTSRSAGSEDNTPRRFAVAIILALSALSAVVVAQPADGGYDLYPATYHWLEIEDFGQVVTGLEDNGYDGPFDIGFEFPFYGRTYTQFYIGTNGLIGLGSPDELGSPDYTGLPFFLPPNDLIALYWNDLDPGAFWADGAVYYGIRNHKLVIEFQRYAEDNPEGRSPDNTITMQVVLVPDGDILLQYKEIGAEFDLLHGSVGIENRRGDLGLTVRNDGEGTLLESETAFLISRFGPCEALIWDAGSATSSGTIQEEALTDLGYEVLHLSSDQQLPQDLGGYEAVFINLGNHGEIGEHYHPLTRPEGEILAGYLDGGGSLYLEGSDTWYLDPLVQVHRYFFIDGLSNGGPLETPVEGLDGSFAAGMRFDGYQADDNSSVDCIAAEGRAVAVMQFQRRGAPTVGMVAYQGENYRTVGCSFELRALEDGDRGTKFELIANQVNFFRSPPPQFPPPTNLHADAGDGEVTLYWDDPQLDALKPQRAMELKRNIHSLLDRQNGSKPDAEDVSQILALKRELLVEGAMELDRPERDELHSFRVYLDGELFDETDAHRYTVLELENGRFYDFKVTAVYSDPDGESEAAGPLRLASAAPVSPPLTEDFEATNGGFAPDPTDGGWRWDQPPIPFERLAWGTGEYPDLARFQLYTPILDLENQNRIALSFYHYLQCEPGWDGGRLEITADGGERWDLLEPKGGYPDSTVFAFDASPAFTGSTDGWAKVEFDLSEFAGQRVRIRFVFWSDESNFQEYTGWYIDNLELFEPQTGDVSVTVTDDLGSRLARALVKIDNLDSGRTGADGSPVIFRSISAGQHTFTAEKLGFVSGSFDRNVVANQDTSFTLPLDPWNSALSLDQVNLNLSAEYGGEAQGVLQLTNSGAMQTDYQTFINYDTSAGDQSVSGFPRHGAMWDLIQTYDLTAATGERQFVCAEFIADGQPKSYKLIAGAGAIDNAICRFFLLDRDGDSITNYRQSFNQPARVSGWGLRDLEYDGVNIYGSVGSRIMVLNPLNGNFVAELNAGPPSPLEINRGLAYIPEEDAFWVGNWGDPWYKLSRDGVILDVVNDHDLSGVAGMAWNPTDPDGAFLYIHNQESEAGGAALYRFNPETRELTRTIETATAAEGTAGGAFVTSLYDTHNYTLGVVIQGNDGDRVKMFALNPRPSWISVTPNYGVILGGNSVVNLDVVFDPNWLIDTTLVAMVQCYDLTLGTKVTCRCSLEITGDWGSLGGTVSADRDVADLRRVNLELNGKHMHPNGDGSFTFDSLFPGEYTLTAQLDSFQTFTSEPINIELGEAVAQDVILIHNPTGRISGQVVSRYGEPLNHVEVVAFSQGRDVFYFDTTDVNGGYSILTPAGEWRVRALKNGWHAPVQAGVRVLDGETTAVNFEMDDQLSVRSLRADGNYDDQVRLFWLAPGTPGEIVTLGYSDGVRSGGVTLNSYNDLLAVRFNPEGSFDIKSIALNFFNDAQHHVSPIQVSIFDENPNNGLPGELIWDGYIDNPNQWSVLYCEGVRFLQGPFYVSWNHDPNDLGRDYMGLDTSFDHPGTVFLKSAGEWTSLEGLSGDPLARAVIYGRFDEPRDQNQNRGAARLLRPLSQNTLFSGEASVGLIPVPLLEVGDPPFDWKRIYGSIDSPSRDELVGYRVYVDGAFEDELDVREWIHWVGSDHENQGYRYSVSAVYNVDEDTTEIPSEEIVAHADMAPGKVTLVKTVRDGFDFTVTWSQPRANADGSDCIDYAGCDIFLNEQLEATIEAPATSWSGAVESGQEDWYSLSLVAFDEVGNRSKPANSTEALGPGEINNFETLRSVFASDPDSTWLRTDTLHIICPSKPPSGKFIWATRNQPRGYDNSADWTLTTISDYYVELPSARLEFYYWMSTEPGHDGGQVQISVEGGDWTLLEPEGGYPDATVDGLLNTPGYSGASQDWQLARFDLGEYEGNYVKLRWRFGSDATINWYHGWFLDDVVFWGCSIPLSASVSGLIRDQFGTGINGARLTADRITAFADSLGQYSLSDLPPRPTTIHLSAAGIPEADTLLDLSSGSSLNLDFTLTRPVVEVTPDQYQFRLSGGDNGELFFSIANQGEIPIPFTIRVVSESNPDRDSDVGRQLRRLSFAKPLRDPVGDQLFDYNLTDATHYHRFLGAEFLGGEFFLTAGDPDSGNVIVRLDREGNLIEIIPQPVEPVGWGMRDLATDGDLLFGSQNNLISAVTRLGAFSGDSIATPLTVNRALTFVPERDAFWAGDWDSRWYFVDRAGTVLGRWADHGLEGVTGFAWLPETNEGMPLFIANSEPDGSTGIYRADPSGQRIERLWLLDGPSTGCFITGDWDGNLWILGVVIGSDPQRLVGIELAPKSGWLGAEPVTGLIEPGESAKIGISLDIPLEALPGERFAAEIRISVFNGELASVPVEVEISDEFDHFGAPVPTADFLLVKVVSVDVNGEPLPPGSEIAAITPDEATGGAAHWISAPVTFKAYSGVASFANGDRMTFQVWDGRQQCKFSADVERLDGPPVFISGESLQVRLTAVWTDTQVVALASGWNLISSNITPLSAAVETVLAGLDPAENLILAKDGFGRFWLPERGYNGLADWDPLAAYWVDLVSADTLIFSGNRTVADTPIPLTAGWNSIAFLPSQPVSVDVALAGIAEDLIIAKNGNGDFYAPEYDYNGIGLMRPGEGYKLNLGRDRELIYRTGEELQRVGLQEQSASGSEPTGADMSLLLLSIPDDWVGRGGTISVITDQGLEVGCAGIGRSPLGIVVRGDDSCSSVLDGARSGDRLQIVLRLSGATKIPGGNPIRGEMRYQDDQLTVVDLSGAADLLPTSLALAPLFPNPFNNQVSVRFALREASHVRLTLCDTEGREVTTLTDGDYSTGWHTLAMEGSDLASGVYLVTLETKLGVRRQKAVLIR